MRIGLALAVTAAALALGAQAQARPTACRAVFDFVRAPAPGGERRALFGWWPRKEWFSPQDGFVVVVLRDAEMQASPRDEAAEALQRALRSDGPRPELWRLASQLSECFEAKDEIDSDVVDRDDLFRAEHFDPRSGVRVQIEASSEACAASRTPGEYTAPCLLITARRR